MLFLGFRNECCTILIFQNSDLAGILTTQGDIEIEDFDADI